MSKRKIAVCSSWPHFARSPGLLALALALASCSGPAGPESSAGTYVFSGTAAVKVMPARGGRWMLLLETLQPQLLVTTPIRSAALLGLNGEVASTYDAPAGWILADAVAHPSGDVSLLTLRADVAASYPLRVVVVRSGADGTRTEAELTRLSPPDGPEADPAFLFSLDRARLVARGEDLFAVVRWANNSVQAYHLGFEEGRLEQRWSARVEPPAALSLLGIIGGGFDNFHQGESAFVYADADESGTLYVAVASAPEVLSAHDAFFGEDLLSGTDPDNFDFDTAVVTRFTTDGVRSYARLLGHPGRSKRLLNMKAVRDSVVLVGRMKTGSEPGSWDGWILSARGASGEVAYERNVDVQNGDMFWDVAPLGTDRFLLVGSTDYLQNPAGLSVSDARDPLALVLDSLGNVEKRIALPRGPAGRGTEAMSVSFSEQSQLAISGVQNAPGTHAQVFSDAFLVLQATP
jgi:hypothetical protein